MKILTIGDLHGRNVLDSIKEKQPEFDLVILLGDYIDPYPDEKDITTGRDLIKYLTDIIDFKYLHQNVVLLIGNHDEHYIHLGYPASRYDRMISNNIHKIYLENLTLFNAAYQIDNTLWTHAGVTKKWLKKHLKCLTKHGLHKEWDNLASTLDNVWNSQDYEILSEIGPHRQYISHIDDCGGPFWADIRETALSVLPGINQIVGHSQMLKIETIKRNNGDGEGYITNVDVLGTTGEFYEKTIERELEIN